MPLAVLRAGTRYEVRGPMTAVLWASGVVQGVGLAKTLSDSRNYKFTAKSVIFFRVFEVTDDL